MIHLKEPVIVEGKYDKITLANVLDALIIPTDGFRIFKNKEKCAMIRLLAQKHGIIVMTDSDSAGALIRSYLKNIVGDAKIIQVYLPQIIGKEKRKARPSKEGFLGVEGMSAAIIEEALQRCGVFSCERDNTVPITKVDLFEAGFSGGEFSSARRREFLRFSALPETLTTPAMLDVLNRVFTRAEFFEQVAKWKNS